ncbi:hypothetical protein DKX38_024367 [Salix brachista]|uniref:Reverse transcriptase/retrotransposon-derived protein RNase H-like domain-containing protein n=1 Tax=Salix brachista TaxID=2182728 RepID=A0A5N5JL74_9ROSI|nr:hypothetical protein DKX38_024367 [Salix brachista]
MTTTPTLAMPNFSAPFTIESDAFGAGIGAVLSQQGQPIAFMSRALGITKQSWSVYAKEMLAIIHAIQTWRPFLLGRNFNTPLPVRFANLTDLISLNLSNAGFIGQIPNDISKLTKLVSLDLSTNYFLGGPALKLEKPNFATLVQNLTHLEELILDSVKISAQGNDWCKALSSSLPNLKVLSMSNCFLSGPLDASLAELRSLSIIRLSSNNLSAPVPEFLANYPKLTALELSSCQLNGIFPKTVFQIPALEILDLSLNELLQGSLPEFHQNLSLQTLVLSNTNFSGTLPQSIGNLEKLSRIELVGNNFTGTIPSSVANLTQLFYLDLSSNKFEGRIPSFRRSEELTYVDLSRNNLTGEIPSGHWEGLLSLTYVGLGYNAFNGSIKKFQTNCSLQ